MADVVGMAVIQDAMTMTTGPHTEGEAAAAEEVSLVVTGNR